MRSAVLWSLRLAVERVRCAAAMRRLPLDAAVGVMPRRRPCADPEAAAAIEAVTEFWMRRVPGTRTTCLPRALARFALLRRAGLAPALVLGVRPGANGEVVGHAWVELDGAPFGELEPPRYTPTFRHE